MVNKILMMVVALLLTACVTQDDELMPQSDRTTTVATGDLSFISANTKRFALHPSVATVKVDERVDSDKLNVAMQSALIKVMQDKGYQQVTAQDSPDLLLGFGMALGSEMSDKEILKRAGLVAGLSEQGVDMSQYEKGSVMLVMFQPYQAMPAWRVLTQGFTDLAHQDGKRQPRLESLVNAMLKSVPNQD